MKQQYINATEMKRINEHMKNVNKSYLFTFFICSLIRFISVALMYQCFILVLLIYIFHMFINSFHFCGINVLESRQVFKHLIDQTDKENFLLFMGSLLSRSNKNRLDQGYLNPILPTQDLTHVKIYRTRKGLMNIIMEP